MTRPLPLLLCLCLLAPAHGQAAPPSEGEPPGGLRVPELTPDALRQGLMPREDLGIDRLQREHPEWDGRGVIVAVLDSGVDLLHPGLQVTSTGAPKIVDFHDATDAGRLETSAAMPVEGGRVRGLTGRLLTLGASVGSQETVRLARLRATSFFPRRLVRRLMRDRKEKREAERREQEDRDYQRQGLTPQEREPEDQGPVYDVVVFQHDGGWACVVDTDEDGDLAEETTLTSFELDQRVARFPDELHFAMGAKVGPDGSWVSFLYDGGGHGTHVAGIIAAYHGEGSPLNGLAPGAQILALKIGNDRQGGATTHMSMIKALDYAARHGALVANASFGGESFFQDNREETCRFVDELVDETGLLCCFSAGNEGPALGTIGAPGLAERVLGIGASVSGRTQASNYGVLDPWREQLFAFSSRGPMLSGGLGVDFLAPGVALSTVPSWYLSSADSWNGTSMAAPQASGALAVLLSALRSEGLPGSYVRVRRALELTARRLPHLLLPEQGAGLLDVPAALAYLRATAQEPEPLLWQVTVHNDSGTGSGLHDRLVLEEQPFRRQIELRPDLPEGTTNEDRAAFSRMLRVEGAPAWCRVTPLLHVTSRGGELEVEIDPGALETGLHTGELRLMDERTGQEEIRVPLTLVRPVQVSAPRYQHQAHWWFQPGDRQSLFLLVPQGASRARVELVEHGASEAGYSIALAAPSTWRGPAQHRQGVTLDPGEPEELSWAVEGGTVLEVVAYSSWQRNRSSELEVSVAFDGLVAEDPDLEVPAGGGGTAWRLQAPLGPVEGRIRVELEGQRRRLPLTWSLARDPFEDQLSTGDTMFMASGSATILARREGEKLRVDLRVLEEFDDFLDDAFWRVTDPAGVVLAHGFLHEGEVEFTAPARGEYRLDATVVARGRTFLGAGLDRMIAAELVRPWKGKQPTVHRDIYEGFPGKGALREVRLDAGGRADLYLRLPDLPAGHVYRGRLQVVDSEASTPLLVTSFHCDTRPRLQDAAALRRAYVEELRHELDHALWLRDRDRIARALTPLEVLQAKGLELQKAEAQVVTGNDLEGVVETLRAHARQEREGQRPDRRKLGRIHGLLAEALLALGRTEEAEVELRETRLLDLDEFQRRWLDLLLARAREDRGRALDAAQACAKHRPADRELARMVIELALQASRPRLARHLADTWLDRFPGDLAGAQGARDLVDPPAPPAGTPEDEL